MRLGPLQLTRTVKAAAQLSAATKELGQTGTKLGPGTTAGFGSGVLLDQDYNADLQGVRLYDEIDKMRLGDSMVKGLLNAVKLPLLSADWYFEPGDDTPEQQDMAEWLNNQIENEMNWTWNTVLRNILLYLDYGAMPFETVFDVQDDEVYNRPMAYLRKLAPRMPRTITEWVVDENGGIAGIVQNVYGVTATKPVPIPISQLVLFIHELEGSNYKGISILRQARKDWYYKDRMQKIGAVIMEKRGAGVDVGKLLRGDPNKKRAAEDVLMQVRTHERAFVLETEDFEYRIEGGGPGKTLDPLPWVNYYDMSMLRGVMAEFLAMGDGSGGSWAMHTDKTSLFLMGLRSIGSNVTETINRHLVPKWCDMNWQGLSVYPKLCHSKLDRRDVSTVIDALVKLIPQNVITVDPDLEEWIRDLLEMPEYERPEDVAEDATEPGTEPGTEPADDLPPVDPSSADPLAEPIPGAPPALAPLSRFASRRGHRLASGASDRVNWTALSAGMDKAEKDIVDAVRKIQSRQIAVLVRETVKRAKSGANNFEEITVPYKTDAAAAISSALADLYRLGQKEAHNEIHSTLKAAGIVRAAAPGLDVTDDAEVLDFLSVRARAIVQVLAARLQGSLLRNVLDQIRRGEVDESALTKALNDLSDRAIKTEARMSVTESLNLGRDSVAKANKDIIKGCEYSSVLDTSPGHETCDPCASADGLTFAYGSAEMEKYNPPYKECLGGNNCRCVLIFTLGDES